MQVMTQKTIHRLIGYGTGILITVAFIAYVQHWIVALILIPGWCLALWNHSRLERDRDASNDP